MAGVVFAIQSWQAILLCFFLAILYVGSLYIWTENRTKNRGMLQTKFKSEKQQREITQKLSMVELWFLCTALLFDHPDVIRKRFTSVGVVCVMVVPILWCFSSRIDKEETPGFFEWLGIRLSGFITALVIPFLLTMILFFGPLSLHYMDGVFRLYLEPRYWISNAKNYGWLRNHVVAPLSEEFIFRACMLPLLVPHFGEGWSIFICPLFFGVAHLHHMVEKITQNKEEVLDAFKTSAFQMAYTTVFGAYSAFLFLRTGHFIAPVMAHAFCNHMGFPAFNEVVAYEDKTVRHRLIGAFVAGLLLWFYLLYPLTSPFIYSNDIYDCC